MEVACSHELQFASGIPEICSRVLVNDCEACRPNVDSDGGIAVEKALELSPGYSGDLFGGHQLRLKLLAICVACLCLGCSERIAPPDNVDFETEFLNFECWDNEGKQLISSNRFVMNATVERVGVGLLPDDHWNLDVRTLNDSNCPELAHELKMVNPETEVYFSFLISEAGQLSLSRSEGSIDFPLSEVVCNVRVRCADEPKLLSDIPGFDRSESSTRRESRYFLVEIERRLSDLLERGEAQGPVVTIQSLNGFRTWLKSEYRSNGGLRCRTRISGTWIKVAMNKLFVQEVVRNGEFL